MGRTLNRVALISLGCAKNLVDSEVMLGYLKKSGYRLQAELEDADIIIVNTCGFIAPAREEAERFLHKALERKAKNPHIKIVAAGCYVQMSRKELENRFHSVDYWTGVNDFHHIVQLIEDRPYFSGSQTFLYDHTSPRLLSTPPSWAYLKISEGCSHRCAFCTIPRIKGPYRSRSPESIHQEALRLVDSGVKEINLISQDSTYYGKDLGKHDGLSFLLEKLQSISSLNWVRVLYAYPEEISDRLLAVMRSLPKVCPYIDSPFQHSDPALVKAMGRGVHGERALALIEKIRRQVPRVAIRSSLIVGFPGEGTQQFARLKKFVREARFDHLGVFLYSHEEGTASAALQDDVPTRLKEERRQEIMELQTDISARNLKKYLGSRLTVLWEGYTGEDRDMLLGRTAFQAPEVDGVVFAPPPPSGKSPGVVSQVEILRSDVYDLYGTIL